MTLRSIGSRAFQFARSVVALAVLVGAVPAGLIWASRQRFGGASPFHGVPSPADWQLSRIWSALSERMTEETVADIVIRTSLVIAWVGLVVFLLTVVAEAAHMVRHAGMHLPDVRGLGLTQHAARVIAAGLLVIVPMVSSPHRAVARADTDLLRLPTAAVATVVDHVSDHVTDHVAGLTSGPTGPVTRASAGPAVARVATPSTTPVAAPTAGVQAGVPYVVRAGDSVFGIAEQVVGGDAGAVADYAERILDANLGRDMGDGRRFVNAAFIDVGWVLQLPPLGSGVAPVPPAEPAVHVVESGESLWSIAEDTLGDPERWPELYAENAGRTFDDGRILTDPDLIRPGWEITVPGTSDAPEVAPVADPPATPAVVPPAEPAAPTTVADDRAGDPSWGAPVADERRDDVSQDVVWVDPPAVPATAPVSAPADDRNETRTPVDRAEHLGLVSVRTAAMLAGGVLALLAVRRRRQLRQAPPRARLPRPADAEAAIERVLRGSDTGGRLARVDIAIRAAALPLVEAGCRVKVAVCARDGEVELIADGPVRLPPPWYGEHEHWVLPATTPIELLAPQARLVGAPCPTLVQLGIDEAGRDVYVDLEALEALEIAGSAADADAIVAALAMTLAGSALAEVTSLVAVEVPDDAFLGHRLHRPARDPDAAFELARREIGTTASVAESTFALRSRVTSGETWEPAVVLVGSTIEVVRPPRDRTGLAVVSAAPIEGPSSRLAPEDGAWVLRPLGVRLRPVGLRPAELDAVADLVHSAALIPTIPEEDDMQLGDDRIDSDATLYEPDDGSPPGAPAPDTVTGPRRAARSAPTGAGAVDHDDWQLLVRVLGPVEVVDRSGAVADFERSKTKELVAWLATHRERSTRAAARTALWDHDVRDATFASFFSEARRALARLAPPPEGDEWVARTMTDSLPLHAGVRTDADLLEAALRAARVQPPDQAILTLTPAVERITGVPFDGTTYLWPDAEGLTSSLILLATSAVAELAAHCLSVGDVEGVFRATGRGLRVLAGHEELIGLRMRAHARVGDLAAVRSEWETYERMIDTDPWSDGEPSPKLVDLRTRLLNPSR